MTGRRVPQNMNSAALGGQRAIARRCYLRSTAGDDFFSVDGEEPVQHRTGPLGSMMPGHEDRKTFTDSVLGSRTGKPIVSASTSRSSDARRAITGLIPDLTATCAAPVAIGTRIFRGRCDRRRLARRTCSGNVRYHVRPGICTEGTARLVVAHKNPPRCALVRPGAEDSRWAQGGDSGISMTRGVQSSCNLRLIVRSLQEWRCSLEDSRQNDR
jgi:hypothetical protein